MNREAIEAIFVKAYDENADALFRFCYFKSSDRELAKDIVQETFSRTWTHLSAGNELSNVRAFIYTVAGNLIKDYWKKKKALPISYLETDESSPFDVMDENMDSETEAEVKQAIRLFGRLQESDREVLTLRFVEGFSPSEIADALGERENTISVRLTRALERLRNLIKS